MKAGFANDEYSHIGIFRHQLCIHPDDIEKIPSSILIKFDQTDYRYSYISHELHCNMFSFQTYGSYIKPK